MCKTSPYFQVNLPRTAILFVFMFAFYFTEEFSQVYAEVTKFIDIL